MSATPKLVVFDCDGTLVDSAGVIAACMTDAFAAVGAPAPSRADVRAVIGLSLEAACARTLRAVGAHGVDAHAAADAYRQAFRGRREANGVEEPLFDGVAEVIADLDAAGAVLAVATGKSTRGLEATLSAHGLRDRFVATQTSDDAPGKPAPDMLLNLSRMLGIDVGDMLMIGDTTFDMGMARAARVRSLGVAWGYHAPDELTKAGAVAIVDDAVALHRAVDGWMSGGG
ncbi:MAG: HAD-IA family hydrolase [Pseudomonadota bacterium]